MKLEDFLVVVLIILITRFRLNKKRVLQIFTKNQRELILIIYFIILVKGINDLLSFYY